MKSCLPRTVAARRTRGEGGWIIVRWRRVRYLWELACDGERKEKRREALAAVAGYLYATRSRVRLKADCFLTLFQKRLLGERKAKAGGEREREDVLLFGLGEASSPSAPLEVRTVRSSCAPPITEQLGHFRPALGQVFFSFLFFFLFLSLHLLFLYP